MQQGVIQALEAVYTKKLSTSSSLEKQIRERAWQTLLHRGLPEKEENGYQYFPLTSFYTDLVELYSSSLKETEPVPEFSIQNSNQLVFMDGRYLKEFSRLQEGIVFLQLGDALKRYGTFLQPYLKQQIEKEKDFFALLTRAVGEGAYFLYIPPGMKVEAPLYFLHRISEEKNLLCGITLQVVLGKKAELTFFSEVEIGEKKEAICHELFDFYLDAEAKLEEYSLFDSFPKGWRFRTTRATVKEKGAFSHLHFCGGAKGAKRDFSINLLGEESRSQLQAVAVLTEKCQSHANIMMEHRVENCESMQKFKQIVGGKGRASFEGKIYVHPEAQKTQAYQLSQSLLLSEQAIAYCKPNLEIFADDVKASHGATISQINPEQLLYLQMRGVPPSVAKELLLTSFWKEMVTNVPSEAWKEKAKEKINRSWLGKKE